MIYVAISFCACLSVVTFIAIMDLRQERQRTRRLFRERLEIHGTNMKLSDK